MYHGVVFGGNRSVACGAFGDYGNVDGNLLAGLYGNVLGLAVFGDDFAAFVDGITGGEFVPVPGDQRFDASFSASLFIRGGQKDYIPIEASTRTFHRDEGVHRPAGTLGANDVHMSDQKQGTRRVRNGGTAQASDQGAAAGRDFQK